MSIKISIDRKDHIKGNKNAQLEIVEFGDYQCPYCAAAHPIVHDILHFFGDQVKFAFRNFPLTKIHAYARPAALAAEAAALQGMFWEMHDAIFDNQGSLSGDLFLQIAEKLELDNERFTNDLRLDDLAQKIEDDFETGMRSGVNGTPTFFVNGEKFHGDAADLFELLKENFK